MSFLCYSCKNLTSLEGAPKEVPCEFSCCHCKNLKSLEGAPEKVGKRFVCSRCKSLTSLEYLPKEFNGELDVDMRFEGQIPLDTKKLKMRYRV